MRSASLGISTLIDFDMKAPSTPMHTIPRKIDWISPSNYYIHLFLSSHTNDWELELNNP